MSQNTLNNQIAVIKNSKTLVEFLDNLNFEKNCAWPETNTSTIRLAVSDYSNKNEKAKYARINLTTRDIDEIASRLNRLPMYRASFSKVAIGEIQTLKKIFSKNPGVEPEELKEFDKSLAKLKKEIESKTEKVELFSTKKIIPYKSYQNPENEKEYRTNGCSISYNPTMKNPIIIEVGNGWATLVKKPDGTINYSNEHDYVPLKKFLTLSDFRKMINKVQMFIEAMIQCGIKEYYKKSQDSYDVFDRESAGVHGGINDAGTFDDPYNEEGGFDDAFSEAELFEDAP